MVEAELLRPGARQPGDDRLIRLVAGIAAAAPDRTLQQIAAQLEAMRERTPRGGTRWHPSSVSEGRRLSRPRAERRRSAARQIHRFVASAEPIVRSTVPFPAKAARATSGRHWSEPGDFQFTRD